MVMIDGGWSCPGELQVVNGGPFDAKQAFETLDQRVAVMGNAGKLVSGNVTIEKSTNILGDETLTVSTHYAGVDVPRFCFTRDVSWFGNLDTYTVQRHVDEDWEQMIPTSTIYGRLIDGGALEAYAQAFGLGVATYCEKTAWFHGMY